MPCPFSCPAGWSGGTISHSNNGGFYDWTVFNGSVRHTLRKSLFRQCVSGSTISVALFGLYQMKGGDFMGDFLICCLLIALIQGIAGMSGR